MVSLSNVTNISDIQCLPVTELYWNFRYNIWPWIDLCIVSLVPMAILFFCNLSIIYFLLKRTQALIQLEGNSFKIMRNTRNYSQVTGYLILLNAVFFICTAPISVYLIREESLLESAGESIHDLAVLQLWQAVVNLLSYTNNAANFLLYVLCGSRFRKEVKTVFCVRDTSTRNRSTFGRMTRVFVVNQSWKKMLMGSWNLCMTLNIYMTGAAVILSAIEHGWTNPRPVKWKHTILNIMNIKVLKHREHTLARFFLMNNGQVK